MHQHEQRVLLALVEGRRQRQHVVDSFAAALEPEMTQRRPVDLRGLLGVHSGEGFGRALAGLETEDLRRTDRRLPGREQDGGGRLAGNGQGPDHSFLGVQHELDRSSGGRHHVGLLDPRVLGREVGLAPVRAQGKARDRAVEARGQEGRSRGARPRHAREPREVVEPAVLGGEEGKEGRAVGAEGRPLVACRGRWSGLPARRRWPGPCRGAPAPRHTPPCHGRWSRRTRPKPRPATTRCPALRRCRSCGRQSPSPPRAWSRPEGPSPWPPARGSARRRAPPCRRATCPSSGSGSCRRRAP